MNFCEFCKIRLTKIHTFLRGDEFLAARPTFTVRYRWQSIYEFAHDRLHLWRVPWQIGTRQDVFTTSCWDAWYFESKECPGHEYSTCNLLSFTHYVAWCLMPYGVIVTVFLTSSRCFRGPPGTSPLPSWAVSRLRVFTLISITVHSPSLLCVHLKYDNTPSPSCSVSVPASLQHYISKTEHIHCSPGVPVAGRHCVALSLRACRCRVSSGRQPCF